MRLDSFNRSPSSYWVLAPILIAGLLTSPAFAERCSCSSPYCSASVSCSGACYAICSTTCSSGCAGGGAGNGPFHQNPGPSPLQLQQRITTTLTDADSASVSSFLSEQLDAEAIFVANAAVTLDVKGVSTLDLLRELAKYGTVVLFQESGDEDGSRLQGTSTFLVRGGRAQGVSDGLTALLQRPVRFSPNGDAPLTIEIKNLPVWELLDVLSLHGELKFGE